MQVDRVGAVSRVVYTVRGKVSAITGSLDG